MLLMPPRGVPIPPARRQLELSDRALIEIGDANVPRDYRMGLGFWPNRYNQTAAPQVRLGFEVAYKNVGHPVAQDIRMNLPPEVRQTVKTLFAVR
jgi:hypothetical protein